MTTMATAVVVPLDGSPAPMSPEASGAAELTFHVEGRAQTAGSKVAMQPKGAKRPIAVESGDRKAKDAWRQDMRAAARDAIGGTAGWPCSGACQVLFVFTRRRPQTHYGRQRGAAYLKASAPAHPTTRPDLLKVARAAEDALTGIVWHDDSVIVDERLLKVWGDREGVTVTVRQLAVEVPSS